MAIELTDLPMVKEGRAERLRAAGIDTVEKLWKADIEALRRHPAFEGDEGFLGQMPLLQGFAEANVRQQALVYAADPRIYELPQPIVHIDLEFDGPRSEIFLYGMLEHDSGKVTSWFDHTPRGQEQLLKDFRKLCQQGTIITWGGQSSDTVQLRRASERFGMDPAWVKKVNWFDLQHEVIYTGNPETQRIYLPVSKFKSERVAQYFGYEKPRLKVKDGYHALRLYRTYKRTRDPQIKKDLTEYNVEDIQHTRIVLDGLRKLMKGQ